MNEGDALLQYVTAFVKGRVPPEQEALVIEAVARTLTMMMTTPEFTNRLVIVQQLMAENWELHQALLAAKRSRDRKPPTPGRAAKRPPKSQARAVKMTVKKPPVKKRGTNSSFKKGASGL
jgi:hypothetical protein